MSLYPEYFNDAVTIALFVDPFIEKGHAVTPLFLVIEQLLPVFTLLDDLGFSLVLDTNVFRSFSEPF